MTETAAPTLTQHTYEWRGLRARELSDIQRKRTEARTVSAPFELREEVRVEGSDGETHTTRTLRSYASLFDTPYAVGSSGCRFDEQVRPGAFRRSLGRGPDVVFRLNHGGPPLARSTNALGKPPTLLLGEDERGLWYEAVLDLSDPDVQALIPKIERGDLSESSFAFRCVRDTWNEDYSTRAVDEAELDRGDVSIVTFGASPTTGRHMLLRSEEDLLYALRELPAERFLTAWSEWRDVTLTPAEDRGEFLDALSADRDVQETRIGKVLSSASLEVLRQVLSLVSGAGDKLDEAKPLLADLMSVPAPKVTSSEQLDHVGRAEERADGAVKPTVAVDFDGTIHQGPHGLPGRVEGQAIEGAADALRSLSDHYRVVVLTARHDLSAVRTWLEGNGMSEAVDDVTNVKPNAAAYVDDRGVHFTNWPDALKATDPNVATDQPVVVLKRAAEILLEARAGEGSSRSTKSPLPGDHARSAPHLLDTVLGDLAHARQHADRLFHEDVLASTKGRQFNAEHLMNHLDSAQEHAQKLDDHLSEHPSDPEVHRSEREAISVQRAEEEVSETRSTEEVRMDPTDADWAVMSRLRDVKVTLALVKACQLSDPDHDTDPDDAAVMAGIEAADAAIDKAIVAQAKDGRMDPEDDDDDEDEDSMRAARSAVESLAALRSSPEESGEVWTLVEKAAELLREEASQVEVEGAEAEVESPRSEGRTEVAERPGPFYWEDETRRDFSTSQREKLAKSGAARPDGSYPITTTADLKNAVKAYGRANPDDRAAVKAHIKKRAQALGATNLLPDDWRSAMLVDNDSEDLLISLQARRVGR